MPQYSFMWRTVRDRRDNDAGWRSKTITAGSDQAAYQKMVDHALEKGRGSNVDFDYEVRRVDVPYDAKNHGATFWNIEAAGLDLSLW